MPSSNGSSHKYLTTDTGLPYGFADHDGKTLIITERILHNIKGVGTVVTGKVEQGIAKVGQEVIFIPSHTYDT